MNQISVPQPLGVDRLAEPFPTSEPGGQSRAIRIDPAQMTNFVPDAAALKRNNIVGFYRRDIKARPFSLLRTQFDKRLKSSGGKLVGVTSAAPGAGKSFLACNLAATLSRLPGRTIYLLDFDFRRCSVAHNLELSGDVGLADFLAGEVDDINAVGLRIDGTSLMVLPTYPSGHESMDLLGSDRFAALIAALRQLPEEAIVICDMPPVFANDDAMIIAKSLDAYLLVVEQGVTNAKQVRDTVRLMDPTPCFGSILNRYSGGFSDPYGYGYGYSSRYSDYYQQPGE